MTAFARGGLAKIILAVLLYFLFATKAWGAYVLPYPSYMPGHKFYRVSRVFDQIKNYWFWGNIAQFKYHMSLADKYLVEAKTLFEYGQYLLAVDGLKRSNQHVQLLPTMLQKAKKDGKDIVQLETILKESMREHSTVLQELETRLPREFTWQPEKEAPTALPIAQLLREAREEREKLQNIHVQ